MMCSGWVCFASISQVQNQILFFIWLFSNKYYFLALTTVLFLLPICPLILC